MESTYFLKESYYFFISSSRLQNKIEIYNQYKIYIFLVKVSLFSTKKKYDILIITKGDKMKNIEQTFKKIMNMEIFFSILYAFIGVIVFFNSEMTNKVVGQLIGTFFLLSGIFSIFTFIDKNKIKLFRYNALFGILSILLGIGIMFNPLSLIDFLNITFGIWLVVASFHKIVYYFYLKKVKEECNKLFLVSFISVLLLGILIILNPFRSLLITKSVGIFVVLYNIVNLNDLFLLKRRAKIFLKLFK